MSFRLVHVDNSHAVAGSADSGFVQLVQQGALLALRDEGYLTDSQYRIGYQMIQKQCGYTGKLLNKKNSL